MLDFARKNSSSDYLQLIFFLLIFFCYHVKYNQNVDLDVTNSIGNFEII